MTGQKLLAVCAALVGAASGCAPDVSPPDIRNLDRPTAVAFACYGGLRITGDGTADPDDEVITSAQPLSSCAARADDVIPPGQEDLEDGLPVTAPRTYGLILEPTRGSVAVVDSQAGAVLDADPLTPGKNAVPIGTLPVSLVTDASGCYAVAANAGTCDLSILDVASAVDPFATPAITHAQVTTPSGEVVLARPQAMVASPGLAADQVGQVCPDTSTGLLYVAYPGCHAVAVIEAGTGTIVSAIELSDDGTAQVTAGELACAAECGARPGLIAAAGPGDDAGVTDAGLVDAGAIDAGAIDAGPGDPLPPQDDGAPRPVALTLTPDGTQLYIVAENSPRLTVIDLDAGGVPTTAAQIAVAGEVGLTAVAATGTLDMGGSLGRLSGTAGQFDFAYAVASDRTVRVIDTRHGFECDTQVDPRFARAVVDLAKLQCFPVGDPATPPRRAGARSPGIQLPAGVAPLAVAFATVGLEVGEEDPDGIAGGTVGHFAFITASNGVVYVVTVDDDAYPDQEQSAPLSTFMPKVMAHQLRDFGNSRGELSQACSSPAADPITFGPRLVSDVAQIIRTTFVAPEKGPLLPGLRQLSCTEEDTGGGQTEIPVSELSFAAPAGVREAAYPDLAAVSAETWRIIWEGPLSLDTTSNDVDGQQIRAGTLDESGGDIEVIDNGAPFCAMGVEPYDIVSLVGCNPQRGDLDCGIGETCYTHPDTPAEITSGMCLPVEYADSLGATCRDLLISRRQYTVVDTYADHLTLAPRRRVLRTTPIAGCTSDAQCEDLAVVAHNLTLSGHPVDLDDQPPEEGTDYQWACAPDPSRAPGPDRCQMACVDSTGCEPGYACVGGFCTEGPLPDPDCAAGLLRYQVRVGDAFSVIGEKTGFVHNRVVDPATGQCIDDPDGSALNIARLPLSAPACVGDGIDDVSPNPCSTTVSHTATEQQFVFEDGRCVGQSDAIVTRDVPAIRFSNPVFTFHLINPVTTGDAECRGDGAGTLPPHPVVYTGYQISFDTTGGLFPMFVATDAMAYPLTITPGPSGRMWVLDQGDRSFGVRGQVLLFSPAAADDGFHPVTIR